MVYLSQLLQKQIYYHDNPIGKILDIAVVENRPSPPISKILVVKDGKKVTLPPSAFDLHGGNFILKTQDMPQLPYDPNDFYLSENMLDKQVIDVDGRRVVRVNDILLENNGELKAIGIDIGLAGILRRLGLLGIFKVRPRTLPWMIIEAFDYTSGNVRLRLTQERLNKFHPAEIADILEEVGVKERIGIMGVLDAQKAASAIEEADNETQQSILQELSMNNLKAIVNKMRLSELADMLYHLNPLRATEIKRALGNEKTQRVERLLAFPENVAGGLMNLSYYHIDGDATVKELFLDLSSKSLKPEAVIVTNGNDRVLGIIYIRHLINVDPLALLKDMISERKFVNHDAHFREILRLFAQYNLRILPVVNSEKQILGVITIDAIMHVLEEEQEKNEVI